MSCLKDGFRGPLNFNDIRGTRSHLFNVIVHNVPTKIGYHATLFNYHENPTVKSFQPSSTHRKHFVIPCLGGQRRTLCFYLPKVTKIALDPSIIFSTLGSSRSFFVDHLEKLHSTCRIRVVPYETNFKQCSIGHTPTSMDNGIYE